MEPAPDISFVTTLFPVITIVFVIAIGVILLYSHFRKNLYKQMLEQEERERKYQNDLLRSTINAQDRERKRIAQDMHDELGATLSIARMHLVQLESFSGDKTQAEKVANVRSLTETALASMRRISHELMPPQLETFGLIKTLEDVAAQLNRLNGITFKLEADAYLPSLMPWSITLGMYRVIMELINNTLKHANASEVCLLIRFEKDVYTFRYCDNGAGLADDILCKGSGWSNIEARINSLQGNYTLDKDGLGFRFSVVIPG